MSTNSAMGVVVNGQILGAYCHWDGYPSFNGRLLVDHYNDRAKAEELIGGGDMSNLGSEIGVKHIFEAWRMTEEELAGIKNMTTYYGRDRGELHTDPQVFKTAEDFVANYSGEYWYLLGTDGVWYVSEGQANDWKKVVDILKVVSEE